MHGAISTARAETISFGEMVEQFRLVEYFAEAGERASGKPLTGLSGRASGAPATPLQVVHQGIKIVALAPAEGVTFDVPLTDGEAGLKNLSRALDFIYRRSPFNVDRLKFLQTVGNVFMIYDPNFPIERRHMGRFGLFKTIPPQSIKREKGGNGRNGKDYVMYVGRHGINWPIQELAGIIIHELVGHGIQHYRGRLSRLPDLDMECEAWLYHEKAHQDFKVDKRSRNMVNFRQNLEFKNCAGFKRFMRKNFPGKLGLWEDLNPDAPRLLEIFEIYAKSLLRPESRTK